MTEHPAKSQKAKLPSPRERLDLILLGLSRGQSVEELCRQAGISRELFYRWMKRVREAGLKALESQEPGPKALSPMNPEGQLWRMEKRIKRLEKKNRKLSRQKDHLEEVVQISRRIIRRQGWEHDPLDPVKKNGARRTQRESFIVGNGRLSVPEALEFPLLPEVGASIARLAGGGGSAEELKEERGK